jgi:hypothetical protein
MMLITSFWLSIENLGRAEKISMNLEKSKEYTDLGTTVVITLQLRN